MNANPRRLFVELVAVAIIIAAVPAHAAPAEKPNVLIIIGDDVGYDAFGSTGSKFARTPAIDQLAEESLVFDRFYSTVSQCAPCRAELYTGLLPINNGTLANARKIARPGVKSIVDHLAPFGYNVGLTGKGHFNKGSKFTSIKGFPAGANSSIVEFKTDGLRDFIRKAQGAGRSFCAVIGSIHAHHPWDLGKVDNFDQASLPLPDHWIDTPGAREALARHAAEVEELDDQVRASLKLLDELRLADNTLVIFLSEQGIAMPRAKWSIYEHGNRSLCLMRWPGRITPRRTMALGQYCDIVPTLIDLAGGGDASLDGFSLRPVLENKGDTHREFVYLSNVHPTWQRAIIHDGWKLVWSPQRDLKHIWNNFYSKSKFFSVPWAEWLELAEFNEAGATKVKHVMHPREYELYRIDDDFYETKDLAFNPENAERIETMRTDLLAFMEKIGDPTYDPEAVAPVGKGKRVDKNKH
ncbi:MAG: sulfatase-like hydrolase/transferase [Fuerstiella sp.]|nr:sulfatase-like hydrolase/transferase [Fuerstiella sp.]